VERLIGEAPEKEIGGHPEPLKCAIACVVMAGVVFHDCHG